VNKHLVCALLAICAGLSTQAAEFPGSEFQNRRQRLMDALPQGIVLLHARSDLFSQRAMYLHSFQQDPNFYYFTGLENALGAILAIDGIAKQSWLFVPTRLSGAAGELSRPLVRLESKQESTTSIEHIEPWDRFVPFISKRLSEHPKPILFTDTTGSWFFSDLGESNPPDIAPIENPLLLWKHALQTKWPTTEIQSASDAIHDLRFVKSAREADIMRQVGKISAATTVAALQSLKPGKSQRDLEVEIVRECIKAGGEGPSFWPWIFTGSAAVPPLPEEAVADYHRLNRRMQSGELAHVDLGCEFEHYGGDVGRTAPVSGRFSAPQREVWELLVRAYLAGLSSIRNGVTREEIIGASMRQLKQDSGDVKSSLARKAVGELLGPHGVDKWLIHGAGLECCERPFTSGILRSGAVIVLEPSFEVDGQAFYLEDMILVTGQGHELLTDSIPYSADEIERLVTTPSHN